MPSDGVMRVENRTCNDGETEVRVVRPSSARTICANTSGYSTRRWSPWISTQGAAYEDKRRAGPPRVARSLKVAPSCPRVPPACANQLLWNWTWRLVFTARSSSRSPALVQFCHRLKFQLNWLYQRVRCRNRRPTHVL